MSTSPLSRIGHQAPDKAAQGSENQTPCTSADGLLEGPTAVTCEKGGPPMADSPHKSVRNQIRDHLRASERLLSAKEPNSTAETRRDSRDSIKRLEHIIAVQEDHVKKMRHKSVGSRSQTLRLRASMKDSLAIYRHTLQQIRQSAETLEISWALHEE